MNFVTKCLILQAIGIVEGLLVYNVLSMLPDSVQIVALMASIIGIYPLYKRVIRDQREP